MIFRTATLVAACAAMLATTATEGSKLVDAINDFTSPTRATVFDSTSYSFVAGPPPTSDGVPVLATFDTTRIGLSVPLGNLNTVNTIDANLGPAGRVELPGADFTVEGVLKAEVDLTRSLLEGTVFELGGAGGPLFGLVYLKNITVDVYTKDNFEVSPVTTGAATEAAFSDGDWAGRFVDDGVDDFYFLTLVNNQVTGFEFGLSFDDTQPYDVDIPDPVSAVLSGTAGAGFAGGAEVDIYGAGTILPGPPSIGEFIAGDATFDILFVPAPGGALATAALLGLAARRRRRVA